MGQEAAISAECKAMERLGWDATQLYVATAGVGSVGTLDELRHHLATGDDLGPAERVVLMATLQEALREHGQLSPFSTDWIDQP